MISMRKELTPRENWYLRQPADRLVRRMARECNLSNNQIANLLGVDKGLVSKWHHGKSGMSMPTRLLVARTIVIIRKKL